jgi:hypothetical protein
MAATVGALTSAGAVNSACASSISPRPKVCKRELEHALCRAPPLNDSRCSSLRAMGGGAGEVTRLTCAGRTAARGSEKTDDILIPDLRCHLQSVVDRNERRAPFTQVHEHFALDVQQREVHVRIASIAAISMPSTAVCVELRYSARVNCKIAAISML